MTTYFKSRWIHDYEDQSIVSYHELDEDRFEQRLVEIFADGRVLRTAKFHPEALISLSNEPTPSLEEIREDPEFTVWEIDADQFETVWARAADA